MSTKSNILAETVVLVVVASAIGLVANTVGPRAIKLTRDYFPTAPKPPASTPSSQAADGAPSETNRSGDPPSRGANSADDPPALEHNLQAADFEQVLAWSQEMPTSGGLIVFVDARPADEYVEGHIPGALHVDHYQQDEYLPAVLDQLQAAQVIVVYCAGGDCEDSIFLSNDLIYKHGLPYEHLHLYEGGMKDWTANGRSVTKGDAP
jgi:rhodanese-related sulfurtransferase